MKSIFLINGQAGCGKNTIAKTLMNKLEPSAWIDIDDVVRVRPWEYKNKLYILGLKNAAALVNNFYTEGYLQVMLSGGIHSQELYLEFPGLLKHQCKIFYIWLHADKNIRDKRRLRGAISTTDTQKHLDYVDSLIPDAGELDLKLATYIRIDTGVKNPDEIVTEILKTVEKQEPNLLQYAEGEE